MALLDQVEQAARRRDEDVDAAAQRQRLLRPLADAAEDDRVAHVDVTGRRSPKLSPIWAASSRVGVSTSALGLPGRRG